MALWVRAAPYLPGAFTRLRCQFCICYKNAKWLLLVTLIYFFLYIVSAFPIKLNIDWKCPADKSA